MEERGIYEQLIQMINAREFTGKAILIWGQAAGNDRCFIAPASHNNGYFERFNG